MRILVVSCLAAVALLSGGFSFAQVNTEKATRETDRFDKKTIEEKILQPPQETFKIKPSQITPGKGENPFFVKKIILKGCESFAPVVFNPLINPFENKETTLSQLNVLAQQIEQDYLQRGVIAAVFVPEQEMQDQTVTLQVVEAHLGEVQIQDMPYYSKQKLLSYWKIKAAEVIRYDQLSRTIQLMNKNPDRQVKAALKAGAKPGTTDVILTQETSFPFHLFYTQDNEGSVSTGRTRQSVGFRHNNLLGLDDILLGGYSFGKDFDGKYIYHNIPVTSNGMNLVYGYSRSESHPKKEYEGYGIRSEAENISIALHQDLCQKGDYKGEVYAGFDAKDKTTAMNTGTSNRDRIRYLSLGSNLVFKDAYSSTTVSPEIAQGMHMFGDSGSGNPLASRNAKPTFTRANLGVQQRRLLFGRTQADLKLKSQVASRKLVPQEEFSLGGLDSVRGYPSGDYLADNAFQANAELLLPSLFIPAQWKVPHDTASLRDQVTSLVFCDYGWGERKGALSTEKKSVDLCGIGFGWNIKLFEQVSLRLSWGFPVGNDPITEQGNSRFHFSLDIQEKLPATLKRLQEKQKQTP